MYRTLDIDTQLTHFEPSRSTPRCSTPHIPSSVTSTPTLRSLKPYKELDLVSTSMPFKNLHCRHNHLIANSTSTPIQSIKQTSRPSTSNEDHRPQDIRPSHPKLPIRYSNITKFNSKDHQSTSNSTLTPNQPFDITEPYSKTRFWLLTMTFNCNCRQH